MTTFALPSMSIIFLEIWKSYPLNFTLENGTIHYTVYPTIVGDPGDQFSLRKKTSTSRKDISRGKSKDRPYSWVPLFLSEFYRTACLLWYHYQANDWVFLCFQSYENITLKKYGWQQRWNLSFPLYVLPYVVAPHIFGLSNPIGGFSTFRQQI
jgi:hypothetical protein